jgi:hypothetical protein
MTPNQPSEENKFLIANWPKMWNEVELINSLIRFESKRDLLLLLHLLQVEVFFFCYYFLQFGYM